jgi:hypothetical protein
MMSRVARGIQEDQPSAIKIQLETILRYLYTAGIDSREPPKQLAEFFFTIDFERASFQFCRGYHMASTAGMDDQCRIGKLLHQAAGATGMIEMDMGWHDIGDSSGRYALAPQNFT